MSIDFAPGKRQFTRTFTDFTTAIGMALSFREEKFKRIRNRWFVEPLGIAFPMPGGAVTTPATCAEFVESGRFPTHDDWELNLAVYGFADPSAIMASLREAFDTAGSGSVNPTKIRDAAAMLGAFRQQCLASVGDNAPSSFAFDGFVDGSLLAEAKAAEICLEVVFGLAHELGITLPAQQPGRRL